MLTALFLLAYASAADVWTQGSGRRGEIVLLPEPGLSLVHTARLSQELAHRGYRVHRVSYDCDAPSLQAIAADLASLNVDESIVIAHGLGARLAIQADLQPAGWLLVGPTLDLLPLQDLTLYPDDPEASERLFGDGVQFACGAELARAELSKWAARGPAPINVSGITAPTLVLVSAGDDVAPVETTVPVALAIDGVDLIRIGVGGWAHADLSHIALTDDPRGRRAIYRALRTLRHRQ